MVHFDNLNIGGTRAASVQPALRPASRPPSTSSTRSTRTAQATARRRVGDDQPGAVAAGRTPTLTKLVIARSRTRSRRRRPEGLGHLLDSGDDRMQQTQFIGGSVWGELGTR